MSMHESFGNDITNSQSYDDEQVPSVDNASQLTNRRESEHQYPNQAENMQETGENYFFSPGDVPFAESPQEGPARSSAREGYQERAKKILTDTTNNEIIGSMPEKHESVEEDGVLFEGFDVAFYDDQYSDKVRVPVSEAGEKRIALIDRSPDEKEVIISAAKEVMNGINQQNPSHKEYLEANEKLYMLERLFSGESLETQMDHAMKYLAEKGRRAFNEAEAMAGAKGGVVDIDGPVMNITFGQELLFLLRSVRRNRRVLARKKLSQEQNEPPVVKTQGEEE